ncbi:MAG: hypothetical protein GC190_12035 [Alphaproteobacteria bacterium]|nr:hypothetical protein [Alphaproteobacteria bacterium]
MKRLITALLGATAMSVMAGGSALAFNKVDWKWDVDVDTHIDIHANIDVCVNPDGLVQVEKLQIFIGNVYASSTVHDIHNYQYNPGYEVQYIPVLVYDGKGEHDIKPSIYDGKKGKKEDPKEPPKPEVKEIRIPVVYPKALDARIDLPSVVSVATAVGNNQNIVSDVPVYLHDGQFVANSWFNCDVCDSYGDIVGVNSQPGGDGKDGKDGKDGSGGNLNTTLAELFTIGALAGFIAPASIEAYSTVYDIKNATVDSSATAVANNINVTLESSNLDNHVLIADITQFAYANVTAVSNVCDVSLHDYKNLSPTDTSTDANPLGSTLGRPIVSSVATAVGNNVNITVGVPSTN